MADIAVIDASKSIPANVRQFLQHFDAIFQVTEAAAFIVTPGDRDLPDGVAALERDEQDFRVETPPLDPLQLEDRIGGITAKCLEAALSVRKWQPHDQTGDRVEASSEHLTVPGLVFCLASSVQPS